MAASVTELALLTIPSNSVTPAQRSALARAKEAMERFSGQPFTYLLCEKQQRSRDSEQQDEEQSSYILIVGGWSSIDFHMKQWIPSEENQALVKDLGDLSIGVRWMWHVGVSRGVVQERAFVYGWEGRVSIWRGAVPLAKSDQLTETLGITQDGAKSESSPHDDRDGMVAGWRLDDGFLAAEEAGKSLRKPGETQELILMGELNNETLEAVKVDAVAWELLDCKVLEV